MKYILILTTLPDEQLSINLTKILLEKNLAACITSKIVSSTYIWENEIKTINEIEMSIKTKHEVYKEVEANILLLHQYSTPQIFAIPILEGLDSYFEWIDKIVTSKD